MGLTLNRLYKLSGRNQISGVIIIGGTGTTIYGSEENPSELTDMVDLNGSALADGTYTTFYVLPQFILFDGDATAIQLVGLGKPEDTEIDIEAPEEE